MSINSKFLLCVILLIAQIQTAGGGGGTAHSLIDQQLQKEVTTVDYCELSRNQAKYAGQLIRVRAVMLAFWDSTSLYDSRCQKDGLEPVLDCKDDDECSGMRKTLERDMDYDGDGGRVEAVFTGSLMLPAKTASPKSRARFMIKGVEQTKRIPKDTPWPGN